MVWLINRQRYLSFNNLQISQTFLRKLLRNNFTNIAIQRNMQVFDYFFEYFLHLKSKNYFCKKNILKIYNSIDSFTNESKTIVTLGTFDGVHLGHKKILEKVIFSSKKMNAESIVLTFFPHPRTVLQSVEEMKQLNTIDEKITLMNQMGIDNLVIHPFDKDFSRLTAEEFVRNVLVEQFNIKKIIIGHDHRFGRNRTADINDLIAFGEEYNFEVEQISAEEINEAAISSTKIRNALNEGNIDLANQYLGYEYMISGKVARGKQLGRTIGFPTANIHIEESYKLIPKEGVYIVKVQVLKKTYFGMLNIGTNPTTDTSKNQKIEVYILDFDNDIYDKPITIYFQKRLRDERKFETIEDLKNQLNSDKESTISFFRNNPLY